MITFGIKNYLIVLVLKIKINEYKNQFRITTDFFFANILKIYHIHHSKTTNSIRFEI